MAEALLFTRDVAVVLRLLERATANFPRHDLALRLDVSQRLSESSFVLTGAIFPRDLAKSQPPEKEVSLKPQVAPMAL